MHVADHLTHEQIRARADAEPDKRRFVRLRAVALAMLGRTAVQIAEALGCSPRAVQAWVARYNDGGPDDMGDRPRPGQPSHLPEAMVERFRARIDAGPTSDDGACTLRAKEVRTILEAEFGVAYSLSGVYALLHRLGYSCLDPRPRHRKSDPEVMDAFKKKSAT